jgi:hypothetical protein
MVFDVARLISDRSIVPGQTYCVNVTDAPVGARRAHWGQHGTRNAPGLGEDALRKVVVLGPRGERNIGFIIRALPGAGHEVRISNEHRVAQGRC